MRRARFDWNASMNTMLGLSGEERARRTSLVASYEAAMKLPVCQLDEIQLGRFWSQTPTEDMLDVLIPTTIQHLRNDLFGAWGTPTFIKLADAAKLRPEHEPALAALIEAWAPRLVAIMRGTEYPLQQEVAQVALQTAERYPSALFAFENAYRAAGDHEGVADILARRARRATTASERLALLVERARAYEDSEDLVAAQDAWLELVVELPERADDELARLFALDPAPPWALLVARLREAAHAHPALRDELLRRIADLAATKLDDPELAREILAELRG